jgi:uncharacterized protein (TIGR02246 family)
MCEATGEAMTMTDEQAIRDVIETWARASMKEDLDTVLTLMTQDVVFLTPGNPPMRGRDAFAASFRGVSSQMQFTVAPDIQEVFVEGRLGYAVTHLTVTTTPSGGGQPARRSGFVLSVFRKQLDGQWAIARDANMLTATDEPQRR